VAENVENLAEVQSFLLAGFKELGFPSRFVSLKDAMLEVQPGQNVPLCLRDDVICAVTTPCTSRFGRNLPLHPIWVNFEVLRPDVVLWARPCMAKEEAPTLWGSGPVWDYLQDNLDVLRSKGWAPHAQYLPLRFYPGILRTDGVRYKSRKDKDMAYDVAFMGSFETSPRRMAVVDTLRNAGVNVNVITTVYGFDREEVLRNSKIVINVHFYSRNFETVRLFYLLSVGTFIVAEADPAINAAAMREYEGTMAFSPYDELVPTVLRYLGDRKAREAIAERGYDWIRETSPGHAIAPLLEQSLPDDC
jgi:hypothetical protein